MILEVRNLHVSIDGQPVLNGIDLNVDEGEVHVIMGPNGSGKSTLAQTLAGHEAYEIDRKKSSVVFCGQCLMDLSVEERTRAGMFLAFQYPVEIKGISNAGFMQSALNEVRKSRGLEELDAMDFQQLLAEKMRLVNMPPDFANRFVNHGFSGGEKKRNEIVQMAVLEPRLAILDETDSGLDIDALRIVAEGINALRKPDRSFILVTHYQRLLNYIQPDFVHVLFNGRIVRSGGAALALELEERGYDWIHNEQPAIV